MIKTYALLKLFPAGQWNQSGNKELASFKGIKSDAIAYFKSIYPELNLDKDGYAKEGVDSFCVAEYFESIQY